MVGLVKKQKGQVQAALDQGEYKAWLRVEGDAKRLCPVDTGRLRSSITTTRGYDRGNCVATIGTNVEYAPYVEFGTGQRGDPAVSHRQDWLGQPPQPYLRPALIGTTAHGNINKVVPSELQKVPN